MNFYKFQNAGEVMTYHNMSLQKKAYLIANDFKKYGTIWMDDNDFKYIVLGEYFDLTADIIEQNYKELVKPVPDLIANIRNCLDNPGFFETIKAYLKHLPKEDPIEQGVDKKDQSVVIPMIVHKVKPNLDVFKKSFEALEKANYKHAEKVNKWTFEKNKQSFFNHIFDLGKQYEEHEEEEANNFLKYCD